MTAPRGRPLSVRLALLLSVVVVAVLLVTGLAVNRVVSQGLRSELVAAQRDRVAFLAEQLDGVDVGQPRAARAVRQALQRIARQGGGRLAILDASGRELVAAGQLPGGADTERMTAEIPGAANLTLAYELPGGGSAFLGVFNATLVIAGILAVGALVLAATLLSDRLTRPIRGVAAAATRLGAGDLHARAAGGPDRESQELADAFNAMAERLERSEELRRRAASDMAHDLATPATVLESQLQAMVDRVVPADREQLERARAAASAMSGVIVQLRELVDVEAATLQRRAQRVPVGELLAEAAQAMEPYFRERRVRLAVEPPPAAAALEVDLGQVSRALRNVLANAAQHSPADGAVQVQTAVGAGEVAIRVTDQGPGIAAGDLPHIFERFYRADQARRGDAGAGGGIGLTIARELLAANGGSIAVERTGPEGTTFTLRLQAAG